MVFCRCFLLDFQHMLFTQFVSLQFIVVVVAAATVVVVVAFPIIIIMLCGMTPFYK